MTILKFIFSAVLLVLGLGPVIVLLCAPESGIGNGQPDPRPWHEIATTALLRLTIGLAMFGAIYYLGTL